MLTAFDVAFGVLVLISAILATARGLTREVLSLATWAGSALIAVWMWQYHPEIARGFIQEQLVADIATVVVTFIVSLIVLHLLTMRIADLVVDSKIGPLDRSLGFVFGVLRGILIAVVLVTFGLWLLGNNLPTWARDAKSLPFLEGSRDRLLEVAYQVFPDAEAWVTDMLNKGIGDMEPEGTTLEEGTDGNEDGTVPPADVPPPGLAPMAPAPTNT